MNGFMGGVVKRAEREKKKKGISFNRMFGEDRPKKKELHVTVFPVGVCLRAEG